MTAYRDRLNAGEHTDPNFKQPEPKKSSGSKTAAKPASAKKS